MVEYFNRLTLHYDYSECITQSKVVGKHLRDLPMRLLKERLNATDLRDLETTEAMLQELKTVPLDQVCRVFACCVSFTTTYSIVFLRQALFTGRVTRHILFVIERQHLLLSLCTLRAFYSPHVRCLVGQAPVAE